MVAPEDVRLDPEAIAARQFPTARKGYDTQAVRLFLAAVAESHRALLARVDAAERSAEDVLADAEQRRAEVVREAQDEAKRQLATVAADRERGHAEGIARAEAEREGIVSAARAEAEALVAEATAARQRVLGDLRRRRKAARIQVEQLHAAREKLLSALTTVRGAIDDTTRGLAGALPEAKAAADAAARRVEGEAEASIEQLEAEIQSLRLAGLRFDVADPADAVDTVDDAELDTGETPIVDVAPSPSAAPSLSPERRSSAVRIVRPLRAQDPVTGLPEGDLQPIEAPDPVEEVRLVTLQELASAAAHVLDPDDLTLAPADDPVAADPAVPAVPDRSDDEVVVVDDPVVADPADPAVPPPSGEAVESRPSVDAVDALFARLRSGRAARVADAEAVLAEEPPADRPESEPQPAVVVPNVVVDEVVVHRGGGAERDDLLARRDALLGPSKGSLARRLKRVLADEQNEILDAMRRVGVEAALPEADEHAGRWAQAAGPDLAQAATAGALFVGGEGGEAPTPGDLVDIAVRLAELVARPLHERLVGIVESAEGDADQAAAGVRAAYRTWRSERLAAAADHAVLDAFTLGAAAALGRGTPVCWIVDHGGLPSPDCEDNALAGSVACGDPFPTGHRRPPAHLGCRCVVAPVTES